jgi:hypothetical protein
MGIDFLTKHFPSPEYLKPKHMGLSFSDSAIKAISVDGDLENPKIKSLIIPLPKGVIVGGRVVRENEFIDKLSIVRSNFSSPFVFFTIPDDLAFIFEVNIPVHKGSNAFESVAFTIEENVPLSLADTIFDFVPTKVVSTGGTYQSEVVVAASVRQEIEKLIKAIVSSGLEPIGCIHESQAIATAVLPTGLQGTFSIVHARSDRVGIYLSRDGLVKFATICSMNDPDYRAQFLGEYQKFVDYSLRYTSDKKFSENVFVCGEFDYAKKVVEILIESDSKAKEAKLSNVWSNLFKIEDFTPNISFEDSLNLAGPVGAVLSDIL